MSDLELELGIDYDSDEEALNSDVEDEDEEQLEFEEEENVNEETYSKFKRDLSLTDYKSDDNFNSFLTKNCYVNNIKKVLVENKIVLNIDITNMILNEYELILIFDKMVEHYRLYQDNLEDNGLFMSPEEKTYKDIKKKKIPFLLNRTIYGKIEKKDPNMMYFDLEKLDNIFKTKLRIK